jgi:hypothetical protein
MAENPKDVKERALKELEKTYGYEGARRVMKVISQMALSMAAQEASRRCWELPPREKGKCFVAEIKRLVPEMKKTILEGLVGSKERLEELLED